MNSITKLPVYRAITGRINKNWIHEGVSNKLVAHNGIFCSNYSAAQYKPPQAPEENNPRVPGLPVFLNFDEAADWIEGKQYEAAPAIVEALLPIKHLYGNVRKIRIVSGYVDGEYELQRGEIEKHLASEEIIEGECYLQGVNGTELEEILGSTETIYRPSTMQNGRIHIPDGFTEAKQTRK